MDIDVAYLLGDQWVQGVVVSIAIAAWNFISAK